MAYTSNLTRTNAERLRALTADINESVKWRDRSPADRIAWHAACDAFHAQYGNLFFPGGVAGWSAFSAGAAEGIDDALLFLDVDQVTFRSGYLKVEIWDRLKQRPLAPEAQQKLEAIALAYLDKRVRREFWHMVNCMRLCGSAIFWERIALRAAGGSETGARKARWMLLARENAPVRRWVRRDVAPP